MWPIWYSPVGLGAILVLTLIASNSIMIYLKCGMAANLTFVSIQARKEIRYGIYFLVILIVGRIAFGFARTLYDTLVPKPPPPPTVGFGVLPAINYPEVNIEYPELKYTIQTPSGELPPFPEQMRV